MTTIYSITEIDLTEHGYDAVRPFRIAYPSLADVKLELTSALLIDETLEISNINELDVDSDDTELTVEVGNDFIYIITKLEL